MNHNAPPLIRYEEDPPARAGARRPEQAQAEGPPDGEEAGEARARRRQSQSQSGGGRAGRPEIETS